MATKQVKWIFEKPQRMGGATGGAYANTLQNTGGFEEELAREAIQNSCDAAADAQMPKVEVVFRLQKLTPGEAKKFAEQLQLSAIRARLPALKLGQENWLANSSQPLSLCYVEDHGTVGIHGDPQNDDSNFRKLLLSLGDGSKAAEDSTGGSFGFGKAALFMPSRIRTIVAYSAFEKDETGVEARLMGCSYFDKHRFDDQTCPGRAWLGHPTGDGADPLEDDEAHKMAELLGFKSRAGGRHGTSILIVDAPLDADRLLQSVADWWWPRLEEHLLTVEVDVNGEKHWPTPRERPDLLPFIECYALARERAETKGPHQKQGQFQRLEGLDLGRYGITTLNPDEAEPIQKTDDQRLGSIALIRSPLMVVSYERLGRDTPPAVGVFFASPEVDKILKLAEPPAHDEWHPQSSRLGKADNPELARKVVPTIMSRLKAEIKKLQWQDAPRPQQERRMSLLERELGALLKLGAGPKGASPKVPSPIEADVRPATLEKESRDRVVAKTRISFRLKPSADDDSLEAIVALKANVLVDEDANEGDNLPIKVRIDKKDQAKFKERPSDDDEQQFEVTLSKDTWLSLEVATKPYDSEWATKFGVRIEPKRGGK